MMDIVVGQRWVSHTEPDLGLGLIKDLSGRLVTIDFPAAEAERTYAVDNAPISRIIFSVGDQITTQDQATLTVQQVLEDKGLVGYLCQNESDQEQLIPEIFLSHQVHLTTPRQRLLSGQLDGNSAFRLRLETLQLLDNLYRSETIGLSGGRMELLPHQLYIAHEVCRRYAPRVLLADEVGLGKTIEAAMIIHQQLLSHQARRVLVLVPESLMHQWFIELLRRFNLHFSLINEERLSDYLPCDENPQPTNPFDMEQTIISSLDIIEKQEFWITSLLNSDWDLLVVDEAHHLTWSELQASSSYQYVEQLAQKTASVLLLTATPEQVGAAGHFARLRLLDPQRYDQLDGFLAEEQDYKSLNTALELLEQQADNSDMTVLYEELKTLIAPLLYQKLIQVKADSVPELIQQLLDLHGTGRVLFRNQRRHIEGFPCRNPHLYLLENAEPLATEDLNLALYPELASDDDSWVNSDPRLAWLVDFMRQNKHKKILVICHQDQTALDVDKYLNLRHGIRTTAFVPELSIIERDRAAAYFAETEAGAQALICSEIGSEGRNFQFAQDLVLFDLPLNPDLVEQRIGRLDRIGQQDDIHIHLPVIRDSAQERLYHWYQEGLDLFNRTASAGYAIYKHFQTQLENELRQPTKQFNRLLEETKTYRIKLNHELQEGKDRLLERNSCNLNQAKKIIQSIQQQQDQQQLSSYMQKLFDEYGVETEEHSAHTWIVKPSEQMRDQHFPGLRDEGQTITFSRTRAIEREDYDFMTWEHPMVNESMEAIRDSELGNAAVASIKVQGLKPGTLLLESCYSITTSAPRYLQMDRYLGLSPLRLLTDSRGKDLSAVVDHLSLNKLARRMPSEMARKATQQLRNEADILIRLSEQHAKPHLQQCKQQARERLQQLLGNEIERMENLARLNPAVRPDEIDALKNRQSACLKAIEQADLQLQAVRLLISR